MPELHLNQFGFTYSACGPFTKNNERIKKYKDVNKRTQSDKVLRDKAFEIASDPKYDVYHRLSNQLHKPIIIQFIRRKVYS